MQYSLCYLDSSNKYHRIVFGYSNEQDLQNKIQKYSKPDSVIVPERPDSNYIWNGTDWILPNEVIEKEYENAIQRMMEDKAHDYGYDSLTSAISYADEPSVLKFCNEGKAFKKWRSLVWNQCFQILNDVRNGNRTIPEFEELVNELPIFEVEN